MALVLKVITNKGIYIRILEKIIEKVVFFLAIYVSLMVMFAVVTYIYFKDIIAGVDTLEGCMLMIFNVQLGSINFANTVMSGSISKSFEYNILMVMFNFMCSTLVINVLIALLSNIY